MFNPDELLGPSSTNGLGNSLRNTLLEALVSEAMTGPIPEKRNGASFASIGGGEGDGGGNGLGSLVMTMILVMLAFLALVEVDFLVLGLITLRLLVVVSVGVDASADVVATSNGAGKDLGFFVIVVVITLHQELGVVRESKVDLDVALLDIVGVSDLDVSGGKGWMEPDMGPPRVERKQDGSARGVDDGYADDGVLFLVETGQAFVNGRAGDSKEYGEDQEHTDEPANKAPGLALAPGGAGVVTSSEPGPEASTARRLTADDELDVRFVELGNEKFLLFVDRVAGHQRSR